MPNRPTHDPTRQHVLPQPSVPFGGTIRRLVEDSEPNDLHRQTPPEGAPNVVVVMLDDVGFGACSTFGGPVPTPTLDRLAAQGLRFNQFHTTAMCSPTRASLLTGRNHHTVHMGAIVEAANGYPGYDTVMPREAATVAEVLRQHGYATGAFGKWHLTPKWEQGPAGPFDRWPTNMGFERFYGFLPCQVSQYAPPMYDQTTPIEPHHGRDDYHVTEDLADQAIEWMQRHHVAGSGRPFFCYFSPGAAHTPLQVPRPWIDQFRGAFDEGWDALRQQIFEHQLGLGVIPADTRCTPRPEGLPAWEDYPHERREVAARLMEVYAGFLAHTDAQVGRLVSALDDLGLTDDTMIIYITGDNGASPEGGIHGTVSIASFHNRADEDPDWMLEQIDDLGSARAECHYNAAWAWATDAPFQWVKKIASHFGGTRNATVVSWPARIRDQGGLRQDFHHVIDIVPTILEAAGIPAPTHVNGIEQLPIDGMSMMPTFHGAGPGNQRTQYFEIYGNRAIFHDGWMASCYHGRLPWEIPGSVAFDVEEQWELYDINRDFSQSVDLSQSHPDKLAELIALFEQEAQQRGVYPLRDRLAPGQGAVPRIVPDVDEMTYTAAHYRMPEVSVINIKNCSVRITAQVTCNDLAEGVIVSQGGSNSGWSLYLQDGYLKYTYNWLGRQRTTVTTDRRVAAGEHTFNVTYLHGADAGEQAATTTAIAGTSLGAGGSLEIVVDDERQAHGFIPRTIGVMFSHDQCFDVGRTTGSPVGDYPDVFPFSGTVSHVTLTRLSRPDGPTDAAWKASSDKALIDAH